MQEGVKAQAAGEEIEGGQDGKKLDWQSIADRRVWAVYVIQAKAFKKAKVILTTVVSFYKPRLHGPSAKTTDLRKTAEETLRQQNKT